MHGKNAAACLCSGELFSPYFMPCFSTAILYQDNFIKPSLFLLDLSVLCSGLHFTRERQSNLNKVLVSPVVSCLWMSWTCYAFQAYLLLT